MILTVIWKRMVANGYGLRTISIYFQILLNMLRSYIIKCEYFLRISLNWRLMNQRVVFTGLGKESYLDMILCEAGKRQNGGSMFIMSKNTIISGTIARWK